MTSKQLLEGIADTSDRFVHSPKGDWYACKWCGDTGSIPPKIRHYDGCIIPKIKKHLDRLNKVK